MAATAAAGTSVASEDHVRTADAVLDAVVGVPTDAIADSGTTVDMSFAVRHDLNEYRCDVGDRGPALLPGLSEVVRALGAERTIEDLHDRLPDSDVGAWVRVGVDGVDAGARLAPTGRAPSAVGPIADDVAQQLRQAFGHYRLLEPTLEMATSIASVGVLLAAPPESIEIAWGQELDPDAVERIYAALGLGAMSVGVRRLLLPTAWQGWVGVSLSPSGVISVVAGECAPAEGRLVEVAQQLDAPLDRLAFVEAALAAEGSDRVDIEISGAGIAAHFAYDIRT